ncbi:hypothetical protein Taro_024858, partial [Colocasia esculenta]|nr:hypothetical protein [Colocasia esculenta]
MEASRGLDVEHTVFVYVVCSLTPSVDTSSVGSPRFCVSQARSFPTEPMTCEAHPYLLLGIVMAERRDVGGGGDGSEEDSTQRMMERIWESLTKIRGRDKHATALGDAFMAPLVLVIVRMCAACRSLGGTEQVKALLGQGVLLWNVWAIWLVRGRLDELPPRGHSVERGKHRAGLFFAFFAK